MKIGHSITNAIGAAMPSKMYCSLVNFRISLRGRKFRLSKASDSPYYIGTHGNEIISIARRNRFKRYDKGIMNWCADLSKHYCLDSIKFKSGDIIIDCGANIGEIGYWAKQFKVKYIAFEPEEAEAYCCDKNIFDGAAQTQKAALWYENKTLEFYSKPDTADGSAIETNDYTDVKKVKAITLDHFVKSKKIKKIKLFKLEAEGAEPEVLMGAKQALKLIEYVSVDCGFERGKNQDTTFNEVNAILIKSGFYIEKANLRRRAFLYKKIASKL